jgi:hypothetical protein
LANNPAQPQSLTIGKIAVGVVLGNLLTAVFVCLVVALAPPISFAHSGFVPLRARWLWEEGDVVNAVPAKLDRLGDEIKAELPRRKIWISVNDSLSNVRTARDSRFNSASRKDGLTLKPNLAERIKRETSAHRARRRALSARWSRGVVLEERRREGPLPRWCISDDTYV